MCSWYLRNQVHSKIEFTYPQLTRNINYLKGYKIPITNSRFTLDERYKINHWKDVNLHIYWSKVIRPFNDSYLINWYEINSKLVRYTSLYQWTNIRSSVVCSDNFFWTSMKFSYWLEMGPSEARFPYRIQKCTFQCRLNLNS